MSWDSFWHKVKKGFKHHGKAAMIITGVLTGGASTAGDVTAYETIKHKKQIKKGFKEIGHAAVKASHAVGEYLHKNPQARAMGAKIGGEVAGGLVKKFTGSKTLSDMATKGATQGANKGLESWGDSATSEK